MIYGVTESQRRAATVVGFTYLIAMITAVFGFYVRGHVIVAGDVAATARNIMTSERLFRLGIASDVMTFVIDIVLITALFVVLKPVNRNLALLATLWRMVETAVLVVVTLNGFAVLRDLSGADYLGAFTADQLQALARLSLSAYGAGYSVGFVFLGLGSTVFGYLWLKSRYIPKSLGALGVFGSLLLALGAFAIIIFPELANVLSMLYMMPLGLFEVTMGFWLLIRGIRPAGPQEVSG